LGESIKHHVKEEEGTMFPQAEKADLDWEALAQEAMERKKALLKGPGRRKAKTGKSAKGRHLKKVA
jgi:hypothetical protein